MVATPVLLGIDLGTSSVKAVLTDRLGMPLAEAVAEYRVSHPRPGWAQSKPLDWWSATRSAVREVMTKSPGAQAISGGPIAIGLSGQMHGVVLARADGEPVGDAVLWADSRALAELELYRALPEVVRARLANPLSPGMAGPILAWFARHEPAAPAEADLALQPKDWLRLMLTGIAHGEPSDASATLLQAVTGGGTAVESWDADVVRGLGLNPNLLPPLLFGSGAPAGALTPGAAEQLGLTPGIVVAAGAGDTPAAALGSGLTEAGEVQLSIGTGVQIVTPSALAPVPSLDPVTHHYRSALSLGASRAGYYRMAAGLNGGLALSWVREMLNASWGELYACAEQPPSATAPIFLPHLAGERTPYLDASMRGAWINLAPEHTRADLMRAALEGVAFGAADAFDALFPTGSRPGQVRLAGGGTLAPAWRQLLADVLDVDLLPVSVTGASARGAALLGAQAAGLLDEAELVDVARAGAADVGERVTPRRAETSALAARRTLFLEATALLRQDRE